MIYVLTLILLAAAGAVDAPQACDPVYAALFTPIRPHFGRYEVCTSPDPLDEAGTEALEPLDAFGSAGAYDRAKLARLYGGTRVHVARMWSGTARDLTSTTRLSPYPDPTLTRLIPGTLEIRFSVTRGL